MIELFVKGRIIQALTMALLIVAAYWFSRQIKKGKKVQMRPLPALDALDEAVARSAEMGRIVHFTPGWSLGSLYNPQRGPGSTAGISLLKKVADSTASRGTGIVVTLSQPEAIPLCDEILRASYAAHNLAVPPNAVRFISTEQFAYSAGVLSLILEERPGANILMGSFAAESLLFMIGGRNVGAVQIGGTSIGHQIPFFVVVCDYCLIGEELFAARAYVEQEPGQLGSIVGQDVIRVWLIALMILGFLAVNFSAKWMLDLLKM